MSNYADPDKKSKNNSSTANKISQRQCEDTSFPNFYDNRSTSVAQNKLQASADSSPQSKHISQLQAIADAASPSLSLPTQLKKNNTGLPDELKSSVESLSGMDMSDVRVHRNSNKPAQLNALAYAQGKDIHLGTGQEQHLPHEAWHVVQQRQGRVQATTQMAGTQINNDTKLETEADVMGNKALSMTQQATQKSADVGFNSTTQTAQLTQENTPVQRVIKLGDEEIYGPSEDDVMALYMKYYSSSNADELLQKGEQIKALITEANADSPHTFANFDDMLSKIEAPLSEEQTTLEDEPVSESHDEVIIAEEAYADPDNSKKDGGVPPLLHTVWVGGKISAGAVARLKTWATQGSFGIVLWMDTAAIAASSVEETHGEMHSGPAFSKMLNVADGKNVAVVNFDAIFGRSALTDATHTEAEVGRPQVASDILRILVLEKYGGVYMDVGGVAPASMDEIDTSTFEFSGSMDVQPGYHAETGHMENGLIIAKKGSVILQRMLALMEGYYADSPFRRIDAEADALQQLETSYKDSGITWKAAVAEYLENKEAANQKASELVAMSDLEYGEYMAKSEEDESDVILKIMKRWKAYLDHLRIRPLTQITDDIRPVELYEVGVHVSHTINQATMMAFQTAVEDWRKQESAEWLDDRDAMKELKGHWDTSFKNIVFKYDQVGYSWQNPGLSTAEELERQGV
ncbi:DUF4157 domain-containing protein [Pseudomonadota bacterium]